MDDKNEEIKVDSNTVIEVLRSRVNDLEWQNTLLQAQVIGLQKDAHNAKVRS